MLDSTAMLTCVNCVKLSVMHKVLFFGPAMRLINCINMVDRDFLQKDFRGHLLA